MYYYIHGKSEKKTMFSEWWKCQMFVAHLQGKPKQGYLRSHVVNILTFTFIHSGVYWSPFGLAYAFLFLFVIRFMVHSFLHIFFAFVSFASSVYFYVFHFIHCSWYILKTLRWSYDGRINSDATLSNIQFALKLKIAVQKRKSRPKFTTHEKLLNKNKMKMKIK